MSSTEKLEQEIKALPDIEKLRLVDAILSDLNRPDPEIDRIRAEEARRRLAPLTGLAALRRFLTKK